MQGCSSPTETKCMHYNLGGRAVCLEYFCMSPMPQFWQSLNATHVNLSVGQPGKFWLMTVTRQQPLHEVQGHQACTTHISAFHAALMQNMMCRDTKLLRAVIREDMSMAMVNELIKDITRAVEYLDSHFTINVNDVHKTEGKSLAVSTASLLPGAVVCQGSHSCRMLHGSDWLSSCLLY